MMMEFPEFKSHSYFSAISVHRTRFAAATVVVVVVVVVGWLH